MTELAALAKTMIEVGSTGESAVGSMARAVGLHQIRAASRGRLEMAMQMAQGASIWP
jgi:hypothetical protein